MGTTQRFLRLADRAPECGHAWLDHSNGTVRRCRMKGPHDEHFDGEATWSVRLLPVKEFKSIGTVLCADDAYASAMAKAFEKSYAEAAKEAIERSLGIRRDPEKDA